MVSIKGVPFRAKPAKPMTTSQSKEKDEDAVIKESLHKIELEFKQLGVSAEYVRNYYQLCAGKCMVGDMMCCVRHECSPTPLPAGFMDRVQYSDQLNLLNYRVGEMSKMFEEKKTK